MESGIKVFVRPRPLSLDETHECVRLGLNSVGGIPGGAWSLRGDDTILDEKDVAVGIPRAFTYDGVLSSGTSNTQVYEKCAKPLLERVFEGFNASFIAYGQTGSGKTHSILGSSEDPGVLPLCVKEAWERIEELRNETGRVFRVSVSYLEVYNEEIQDLLAGREGTSRRGKNLKILGDDPRKGAIVEGLCDIAVESCIEVSAVFMLRL